MPRDHRKALLPRFAAQILSAALRDTPVVMVTGPRQCGKTTLVRDLLALEREFLTMDDDTALAAARTDPTGLVRGAGRITIDEVQRAPDLLRAIKRSVDENRQPGRFLLTGSANLLALPQVSESLAGRMEIVTLLPLSQAEIRHKKSGFLEAAFAGRLGKPAEPMIGKVLIDAVLIGGYPEMLRRNDPKRRRRWALDYVKAIVQRDVRDIADVEKLDEMPRLLRVLASHSGQLINFTQVGGQIGFDDKTTRKYIGILEQLFLVRRVEPWFQNRFKRLIKTPKLHFLDSGLLAALSGVSTDGIVKDRSPFGPLLETFVFGEVLKQATWSDEDYTLYHYRDKDQDEVDLVIEKAGEGLIGLEVKASATVNAGDFRGLRKLAAACGHDFKLGVVFYDGEKALPFGDRLFAAPISCAWT
jgi:predicted AAA+ superfamily ATPase